MANETMTLIQKITVGAAGTSAITFSNIPQTYTDLVLMFSLRGDRNAGNQSISLIVNGSTSTYSSRYLRGDGASTASYTGATSWFNPGEASAATATSNTFSSGTVYIPNYTGSTNKSFSFDNVQENNTTSAYATMGAGLWSTTSAITSIELGQRDYGSQNFVQYSTATLYGVVKQGVTPTASSTPYATGGDSITFDGTNWIHTFYSTGTFTPSKALSNVDFLVVAGGGGGGISAGGGGGGGGLRSTVTATGGGGSLESKLSLSAQAYTVTVGAGGAASSPGVQATQGGNSVFATITSIGGGKGGAGGNGGTGGSGGGGEWQSDGAAGTANQGYSGSNGSKSGPPYKGGGGGGAGAAGSVPNGGNGVATSISGSSVTYAGGGGGGSTDNNNGAGGSGGGGAGGTGSVGATGGLNNTGGGAGGSGGTNATAAGGSGIVIVRYPA